VDLVKKGSGFEDIDEEEGDEEADVFLPDSKKKPEKDPDIEVKPTDESADHTYEEEIGDWRNKDIVIGSIVVSPGEIAHLKVKISEGYTARPVHIPVSVINGVHPGPTVFLTAAIHGDELNGVEIVREVIYDLDHNKINGALVCIPVVNVPGFYNSSRYLPDRRDLNREFPGDPYGNAAERIAYRIFQIIAQCDYGIDLHTASKGRSNMPHIRGDIDDPDVLRMAKAFGTEVIIDHPGTRGSLRRNAVENSIPTILLEAGEHNKFEPEIIRCGYQGVLNVLVELGVSEGDIQTPPFRVIVKTTEWVRASRGGIMDILTHPRALVYEGDELATVSNPFRKEREVIRAPLTGMVVGIATNPLVFPGSPVCHLVKLDKTLSKVEEELKKDSGSAVPL
jgi:predicted deacylase